MKRFSHSRPIVLALYANAALLAGILLLLLVRASGTPNTAWGAPPVPQPIAGNGSLYLMPAQLLNNVWGCYVLDTDNQILCAYAYNGSQLRLIASRGIRFDHQLSNYNTHPDPEEIRRLIEIEKARIRGSTEAGPTTQQAPGPQ